MGLSETQRDATISQWIKRSSDNEQTQQDRADRMVRSSILANELLAAAKPVIYTKGSYPNNTNVRRDSDVDVVVEFHGCIFSDFKAGVIGDPLPAGSSPYSGPWKPSVWRAEINKALVATFDADNEGHVSAGKIAINIDAVKDSRPSIDVVPSFLYRRYNSSDRSTFDVGSYVRPTSGLSVINWPDQQLKNGQAKNSQTQRYKNYVRALKNAENVLAEAGTIELLPSYFMECLVYNVPNEKLTYGSLSEGFGLTIGWMYQELKNGNAAETWVEPNYMKWLFKGTTKWSVAQAMGLLQATWTYLGYGDDAK